MVHRRHVGGGSGPGEPAGGRGGGRAGGPAGKFDLRQLFLGLLWGPTRKDAAKNIVDIRRKHPRTRFRCMHEDRKKARPWLWKIWTKHKATFFRLAGYTTLPALGRRRRGDGVTQVTREATTEEIDALLEDVEAALGGHFVGGKLIESTIKTFKAVARSTHGKKNTRENKPLHALFFGGTTASDGFFSPEGSTEEVDKRFGEATRAVREASKLRNRGKNAERAELRRAVQQELKEGVVAEAVAGVHAGHASQVARGRHAWATRGERLNSQHQ